MYIRQDKAFFGGRYPTEVGPSPEDLVAVEIPEIVLDPELAAEEILTRVFHNNPLSLAMIIVRGYTPFTSQGINLELENLTVNYGNEFARGGKVYNRIKSQLHSPRSLQLGFTSVSQGESGFYLTGSHIERDDTYIFQLESNLVPLGNGNYLAATLAVAETVLEATKQGIDLQTMFSVSKRDDIKVHDWFISPRLQLIDSVLDLNPQVGMGLDTSLLNRIVGYNLWQQYTWLAEAGYLGYERNIRSEFLPTEKLLRQIDLVEANLESIKSGEVFPISVAQLTLPNGETNHSALLTITLDRMTHSGVTEFEFASVYKVGREIAAGLGLQLEREPLADRLRQFMHRYKDQLGVSVVKPANKGQTTRYVVNKKILCLDESLESGNWTFTTTRLFNSDGSEAEELKLLKAYIQASDRGTKAILRQEMGREFELLYGETRSTRSLQQFFYHPSRFSPDPTSFKLVFNEAQLSTLKQISKLLSDMRARYTQLTMTDEGRAELSAMFQNTNRGGYSPVYTASESSPRRIIIERLLELSLNS